MTAKKSMDAKAKTIVANDPNDRKGELKYLGGSQSDCWNNLLANQAAQALWTKHSDNDNRDRQLRATVAALVGIGPNDELEGMMAAQLIAAHNAAMECYRRAMIGEQTFEGRRENLNQANRLSRTWATLLDALNKHRGKGHQKVTVEHVHVHAGGQAVVGTVEAPRGWGSHEIRGTRPCKATCPCTSAYDAGRAQERERHAGRRRWRTAAAGCTADRLPALRRVTGTPSSMDSTRPTRSSAGANWRR
jgi:hypothetical protein